MNASRRTFNKLLLAGVPLSMMAKAAPKYSKISGIQFGVESFSFHDVPRGVPHIAVPMVIQYMKEAGLAEVELMYGHIEPFGDYPGMSNDWPREEERRWRLTVSMSHYENIRKQFESEGMRIYVYDIHIPNVEDGNFTDEEIDRTFQAAKALGARAIGTSCRLSEARRLIPFAEKYDLTVFLHNHLVSCNPDELATPESLEAGLALSKRFDINLDLAHYAAGNQDPVAFVKKHAARTTLLHVRDRKKNNGPHTPLGEGDGMVKEVMRLIRDNHYPIRCYIESETGSYLPPVQEVIRHLEYCKKVLESNA